MPIRFHCPHCEHVLSISRRKSGVITTCPKCGRQLVVPTPMTAEVPEDDTTRSPANDASERNAPVANPEPPTANEPAKLPLSTDALATIGASAASTQGSQPASETRVRPDFLPAANEGKFRMTRLAKYSEIYKCGALTVIALLLGGILLSQRFPPSRSAASSPVYVTGASRPLRVDVDNSSLDVHVENSSLDVNVENRVKIDDTFPVEVKVDDTFPVEVKIKR